MYDVAIVGAGPAGSTAARYLAKQGFSVCLLDRYRFPRDKPCGGGFSPLLIDEFSYLKGRGQEFRISTSKVGVLHSSNGHLTLKGRTEMFMTLRTEFDNALLKSAIGEGAQFLAPARVKSIRVEEEMVTIQTSDGQVVTAKAIVGADGVNSTVAHETGLNRRWPPGTLTACKVMEVPAKESQITEYYGDDKEYHFFANFGDQPGYGWVFPKTDSVNVGLGMVTNSGESLAGQFALFVKTLQARRILIANVDVSRARGALVPTAGPISHTTLKRCVLAGDSAGFVSPLTGGGIAYAMRAGKFAASAIGSALEHDNFRGNSLITYERAWQHSFGRDMKRQLIAQKLFTSPLANTLFEIGDRDRRIQQMVAQLMSTGSTNATTAGRIAARSLWVCLREALHL